MHINEQTVTRLRRSLAAAGFRPARVELGEMVYTDFVPDPKARRIYRALARFPLTARLAVCDMFGLATKP